MPWYENMSIMDFEDMVISEVSKRLNITIEESEKHYHNNLEKRSCFDYGEKSVGINKDGNEYCSTRLAILRILSESGIVISGQI